jgi:hypothetical protein
MPEPGNTSEFAAVDRVVADSLRFRQRLRIGDDAYAIMRVAKPLQQIWDVGGVAVSGGTVAGSSTVATTLFAHTASGGLLGLVGLGTAAATPLGWVTAAALLSGGAYWGVTRLFRQAGNAMVDTIPKFINTPIDLLAAGLMDLMGALAVRVATIDGHLDPAELEVIANHFVRDWGYDALYVDKALQLIARESGASRVKDLARALAEFQAANPDCNAVARHAELIAYLRDIAAADGVLDEREELAIDAIEAVFRDESEISMRKVGRSLSAWPPPPVRRQVRWRRR